MTLSCGVGKQAGRTASADWKNACGVWRVRGEKEGAVDLYLYVVARWMSGLSPKLRLRLRSKSRVRLRLKSRLRLV